MAISMAKTIKEERLRWVLLIVGKEVKQEDVVKLCPYGKRSLERWLSAYRRGGEDGLEPKSTRPKSSPRETPIRIKEEVIALRRKKKVCALKLHWKLKKQGLFVPVRTIGKILQREGLVRKYRVKKLKYKYIKVERKPGELVEIDVKHVPGPILGHQYFQYTAIDTASRWRLLRIYDEESTAHSVHFLGEVIQNFP
ncbi:MAG: helix-turn-helix domain-containing protein, partial [Patescibacteria group bacterium]